MPRKGWKLEEDISRAVWKRILMGPRPPSARWPTKGTPSSPASTPSKPEHTQKKVHQKVMPKSKVESIQAAISTFDPDPDSTVLSLVARGFAEGQGHVWEAREPSPGGREKPPREGLRKQKRESHDWRGPSSCWVWTVQMQSQSKSLWKRREVNVGFSQWGNVSILV